MPCAWGDGLRGNLTGGPLLLSFSLLLGWLCTCRATSLRYGAIRASSMARSAHYQAWEIQGEGRVALSQQPELLGEPGVRFGDCISLLSCMFCWCLRPARSDPSDLPEVVPPLSSQDAVDLSQGIGICLQLQRWWSALSWGGSALCNFLFLWHHLAHASTALSNSMKWCSCNMDLRE